MQHESTITITEGSNKKTVEIVNFTAGENILGNFEKSEDIIALKINNEILPLAAPVMADSVVEAVYKNSKEGSEIYRRTLTIVLAAAVNKLYPNERLLVGHSLSNAYYYSIDFATPNEKLDVASIKSEMQKIIKNDLPIEYGFMNYSSAEKYFTERNLSETLKQIQTKASSIIAINQLDDFLDLYFGPLTPTTGVLNVFDILEYHEGFLLCFPAPNDLSRLPEFVDSPKLFEIYKSYKDWGKRVKVMSTGDLNELVLKRKINDFIDIAETFQNQNYSKIAHQIAERGNVRVVLLAGPSSSGKTTSAKKLSLQLQALGYNPKILSLDNYYVGREQNPKDENGNYDYECLEALDIALLNQNLVDLFDGKEIEVPQYNFDIGERFYNGQKMHLDENDILVMEGIHGLNDKLTPLVPKELKFKVYLSALTQLNVNDHNRIPTSDNRLIRRIVRDARYRGKTAAQTISMWDSVQRGEKLHIFPFQNNADAMMNTALDYELSVLKVYAQPLLECVKPTEKEYTEARRLLDFLKNFTEVPATTVPKQSVIREFIGGSSFHY